LPAIEGVIRETVRLIKNGPALRRNLADNLQFADKTIDKGAYVVYNMADVHLNETLYSEPLKFDPSRFDPPREEDKQGHLLFLGWGAGRHICPGQLLHFYSRFSDKFSIGMKIAKLEIKMILALFLSGYEYETVNGSGRPLKQPLEPDRNDIHQVCPFLPFSTHLVRTKSIGGGCSRNPWGNHVSFSTEKLLNRDADVKRFSLITSTDRVLNYILPCNPG